MGYRNVPTAVLLSVLVAACSEPAESPVHKSSTPEVQSAVDAAVPEEAHAGPDLRPPPAAVTDLGRSKSSTTTVAAEESVRAPVALRRAREPGSLAATVVPAGKISRGEGFLRMPGESLDRERYGHYDDNPVKLALEHPVSTFSIDVDTGAYANVRRFLNAGRLPPEDAVRVEEMINYFSYAYQAPADRKTPFRVSTTLAPAPWASGRHLLRIGIQGYRMDKAELAPANLVFLIDVSGSMGSPDKLPLLKSSMKLLASRLRPEDRVAIVVYAGSSGVVLEPTPGDRSGEIVAALDRLHAGGSTNGAAGIRLAYALARQSYVKGGINRILIATDGDFNVGTVDFEKLIDLVESERDNGVSLTTLGFGTGNYNEHLMEQLADAGNGNYAYIDTLREANKVLVNEMAGTLVTIAKDVKVQIEFNPAHVAEYRLIGYENRTLRREDFNNDRVDAGEVGAGHSVTALYELALVGGDGTRVDPLRYSNPSADSAKRTDELAFLRVRYKAPEGDESRLLEWPLMGHEVLADVDAADADFRFASAVAGFGQLLRGGQYTERFGYDQVLSLARGSRGDDANGYRSEFLSLVNLARTLDARASSRGPTHQIASQ
jgi:Ca-activated chloride channel family protein